MKTWIKKLVEQFEVVSETSGKKSKKEASAESAEINEEKATLLYILDTMNKNLLDFDLYPQRKTRDQIDKYIQKFVTATPAEIENLLFDIRQFYSGHRIAEFTYVQKNFDDFKKIIWEFADQLGEEIQSDKIEDEHLKDNFQQLKEAVDSNSIETLKKKSREFINSYIEIQSTKNERKQKRLTSLKKNINSVKKQLMEANHSLKHDHLTGACNRKNFDEHLKKYIQLSRLSQGPMSLLILDIDHFKKVNDTYGHDIGDFVLKECVRLLKEVFTREDQNVYRIGGEEFAIILPDFKADAALHKATDALQKIQKEVFVHGELKIQFTISIGLAEHLPTETESQWLKRADSALYESKHTGRNKCTVSGEPAKKLKIA